MTPGEQHILNAIRHVSAQIHECQLMLLFIIKAEKSRNIDPQLLKLTHKLKHGTDDLQAALDRQANKPAVNPQ